jgi:hypothetical protein
MFRTHTILQISHRMKTNTEIQCLLLVVFFTVSILQFCDVLKQGYSTSCVVWAALENIGLHTGNLKCSARNKQWLNARIIVCIILAVCLCVRYIMCSENMLIIMEIVRESGIAQGVTTFSTFFTKK